MTAQQSEGEAFERWLATSHWREAWAEPRAAMRAAWDARAQRSEAELRETLEEAARGFNYVKNVAGAEDGRYGSDRQARREAASAAQEFGDSARAALAPKPAEGPSA